MSGRQETQDSRPEASRAADRRGPAPVLDRAAPDPAGLRASAIFICFNQRETVEAAFESLLAQTVPLEIVASDDASTDGTIEVLLECAARHRGPHSISVYRQPVNLGIRGNFVFAFERTRSPWVALFEGDDRSQAERIERQLELATRPGLRLVGSELRLPRGDLPPGTWRYPGLEHRPNFDGDWMLRGCGLLIHRDLVDRFPPIPRATVAVDLLLNWRCLRHFGVTARAVVGEPLVDYRMTLAGATRSMQLPRDSAALPRVARRQWREIVALSLDTRRTRSRCCDLPVDAVMTAATDEWIDQRRHFARILRAVERGPRGRAMGTMLVEFAAGRSPRRMTLGLLRRSFVCGKCAWAGAESRNAGMTATLPALRPWPAAAETVVARFDQDGLTEPAAAIVIPCFEMAEWVGAAVSSALAQTVPVEIVVRDDASGDDTVAAVLAAVEAGFPGSRAIRVIVVRGEHNLGLGLNFSLALRHTRARWVFNFDADDVSSPERVAATLGAASSVPDAAIAFVGCVNAERLDELPSFASLEAGDLGPGRDQPWTRIGAGMAIVRDLVETFGPLGPAVLAHDHHLRARALALGDEVVLGRRLVKRRVHDRNASHVLLDQGDPVRLGRNVADQWCLVEDIAGIVRALPNAGGAFETRYRALIDDVIRRWYSLAERGRDSPTVHQRRVVRSLWAHSGRGLGWARTEAGGHLRRFLRAWRGKP